MTRNNLGFQRRGTPLVGGAQARPFAILGLRQARQQNVAGRITFDDVDVEFAANHIFDVDRTYLDARLAQSERRSNERFDKVIDRLDKLVDKVAALPTTPPAATPAIQPAKRDWPVILIGPLLPAVVLVFGMWGLNDRINSLSGRVDKFADSMAVGFEKLAKEIHALDVRLSVKEASENKAAKDK